MNTHRPQPSGTCYTLEGFQIRNTFNVFVDQANVPSGVDWNNDVSNAMAQWNSHTHFLLYRLTSNPNFAQLSVYFGPVNGGNELGVASVSWVGKTGTETNATITLDQTRPWSDNPSRLITQYSVEHVLLHEFGHITGLNHTDCNDQVMFLYTYPGPTRVELGDGDIAGEQSIYGN